MVYNTPFLGSAGNIQGRSNTVHGYFYIARTHRLGYFCPFFEGYNTHFLCAGTIFERPVTPGTRLLRGQQTSSFRALLAIFVGHNTLFSEPGTIFKAGQIRFTAICTSLELVVWDTSVPFSRAITHSFCVRGLFERPVKIVRAHV